MATKSQKQLLTLGVIGGLGYLLYRQVRKPQPDMVFTTAELERKGFYENGSGNDNHG